MAALHDDQVRRLRVRGVALLPGGLHLHLGRCAVRGDPESGGGRLEPSPL